MPDSIEIRSAVLDEATCLSSLALRSKAYWGYSREFMQACEQELTYQPGQIADERSHFVVAEYGSGLAGFYALELMSARQFELIALFVEPKHIGKGIGRELMTHALENVVARSGISVLIQGDPNAVEFYLAAGAKQIGSRESGSIPGRFLPVFEILIRTPDTGLS